MKTPEPVPTPPPPALPLTITQTDWHAKIAYCNPIHNAPTNVMNNGYAEYNAYSPSTTIIRRAIVGLIFLITKRPHAPQWFKAALRGDKILDMLIEETKSVLTIMELYKGLHIPTWLPQITREHFTSDSSLMISMMMKAANIKYLPMYDDVGITTKREIMINESLSLEGLYANVTISSTFYGQPQITELAITGISKKTTSCPTPSYQEWLADITRKSWDGFSPLQIEPKEPTFPTTEKEAEDIKAELIKIIGHRPPINNYALNIYYNLCSLKPDKFCKNYYLPTTQHHIEKANQAALEKLHAENKKKAKKRTKTEDQKTTSETTTPEDQELLNSLITAA